MIYRILSFLRNDLHADGTFFFNNLFSYLSSIQLFPWHSTCNRDVPRDILHEPSLSESLQQLQIDIGTPVREDE